VIAINNFNYKQCRTY